MAMLTQTEEQVLSELDRLIDWHRENGQPIASVTRPPYLSK